MKAIMEKQHFGEYHGKYEGYIYTVYRTNIKAEMSAAKAIPIILDFCRKVNLPDNLEDGSIKIFRNLSNKQNSCYRFEVRTKEYLEVLEYDINDLTGDINAKNQH